MLTSQTAVASASVQTVEDDKKLFTKAQMDRADKAKNLMKTPMMPSVRTSKKATLTNQIQNCLVTKTVTLPFKCMAETEPVSKANPHRVDQLQQ